MTTGVEARVGHLSFGIMPSASYQQNRSYRTVEINDSLHSTYTYPWIKDIDWRLAEFQQVRLGSDHIY